MIPYIATEQTITLILDDKSKTIHIKSKSHRNDVILAIDRYNKSGQTEADRKTLDDFLTPIKRVILESDSRFEIDVDEKKLFLKGSTVPVAAGLSEKIMDFLDAGLPINPLVRFWESCLRNPHFVAVEELFQFLERNELPITEDGAFLGYKKLNFAQTVTVPEDFEELIIDAKGDVRTIQGFTVSKAKADSYKAFVNAANNPMMKDVHSGTIKQKLGDIVQIQRVKFNEHERREACGYGLHIGAFGYGFPGTVRVLCKVFPEDVIACNPHEEKLRTCKYQIVSFVDENKKIAEMLVDFSGKAKEVVDGCCTSGEEENYTNEFEAGDIVVCTEEEDYLTVGRSYYVIDSDETDIAVLSDQGSEEWYLADSFALKG